MRAGIEDGDVAGLTVGDEAAVQVGDDGDDVVALLAGDVGDGFAVGFAEDHRVRGARDIEEFGLGIDGEVVPPAVAADVESVSDLERPGVGSEGVGLCPRKSGCQDDQCDCDGNGSHGNPSVGRVDERQATNTTRRDAVAR